MKVLLVDDDPDLIVLATYLLENLGGFEVVSSEGGYGVIDLALEERPDVILMDYLMPDPNGAALARRLAVEPGALNIPLVFLTAKDGVAEQRRLLDLGARGVLVKPFDPKTLASDVKRLLEASPRNKE